jgi:uncharacterized membrane protein YfcA
MTTDPYKTPKSNLEVPVEREGSPIKAIIVATLVDFIGTIVISMLVGIIYAAVQLSKGVSPDELTSRMANIDKTSLLYIISLTVGFGMTLFSGYLCARIANRKNYKAVNIYLIIMVVVGTAVSAAKGDDIDSLENIILTVLAILSGYIGAWLHMKKN